MVGRLLDNRKKRKRNWQDSGNNTNKTTYLKTQGTISIMKSIVRGRRKNGESKQNETKTERDRKN